MKKIYILMISVLILTACSNVEDVVTATNDEDIDDTYLDITDLGEDEWNDFLIPKSDDYEENMDWDNFSWDYDEDLWGTETEDGYVPGLHYFTHPTLLNGYVSNQGWEIILESVGERITNSSTGRYGYDINFIIQNNSNKVIDAHSGHVYVIDSNGNPINMTSLWGNSSGAVKVPPGMSVRLTASTDEVNHYIEGLIIMMGNEMIWEVKDYQINTIEIKTDAGKFLQRYEEKKSGSN